MTFRFDSPEAKALDIGEWAAAARSIVRIDLLAGLGVEDIALRRKLALEDVRDIVGDLRRIGDLRELFRKPERAA